MNRRTFIRNTGMAVLSFGLFANMVNAVQQIEKSKHGAKIQMKQNPFGHDLEEKFYLINS